LNELINLLLVWDFGFFLTSKHGYVMGNMDVGTHPKPMPKTVSNIEKLIFTHWYLSCYKNC